MHTIIKRVYRIAVQYLKLYFFKPTTKHADVLCVCASGGKIRLSTGD